MALVKYVVFHPWKTVSTLLVGVILGFAAFYFYEINAAFAVVASEDFNPEAAREAIAAAPQPEPEPPVVIELDVDDPSYDANLEQELIDAQLATIPDPRDQSPFSLGDPIDDSLFETYLLVGTDQGGALADSIILALQPSGGGTPALVSLPRDLWVWNVCKNGFSRLNVGMGGCAGYASGPEMMAIMVEDYTGIPVDHLARINFGGFARLVNTMGGVSVCVDFPTRDLKSHLEIENPGCQSLDGETALAWVRSRHTEQLKGEDWIQVAGSDFARQRRQQDVLFQLAGRAASFSSPTTLADRLSAVASSVRLDSEWSFGQAVAAGWKYRGIKKSQVHRFSIEIANYKTKDGKAVLLPTRYFADQLAEFVDLE